MLKENTNDECNGPKLGETVFSSGIVRKLKRDQHGRLGCHKSRLVGHINYHPIGSTNVDLYAPVAYVELVRILLTVATALGLTVEHVDIKEEFL